MLSEAMLTTSRVPDATVMERRNQPINLIGLVSNQVSKRGTTPMIRSSLITDSTARPSRDRLGRRVGVATLKRAPQPVQRFRFVLQLHPLLRVSHFLDSLDD